MHEDQYNLKNAETVKPILDLKEIEQYLKNREVLSQNVFYINAQRIIIFPMEQGKHFTNGLIVDLIKKPVQVTETEPYSMSQGQIKLERPSLIPIKQNGVLSKIRIVGG